MKLAQRLTKIIRPVIRTGGILAAVALVAIMLVTVLDVFLRYVFNRPLLGTIEITESLMVTLSFLAIASCAFDDGHVSVDLVVLLLKKKWKSVFHILGYILGLLLFVPMTYVFVPEAFSVWEGGEASEVLAIPSFPFYVFVIIGCAAVTIVLIIQLLNSIQRLRENDHRP